MLTVVPQPPSPLEEARRFVRVVEQLRPPPVPWRTVAEWLLLPCLVALIICQTTGRVDRGMWLLAGAMVALLFIPVVGRWLRGSG